MRATHATLSRSKRSLYSVPEEDPATLDDSGQLLTPRDTPEPDARSSQPVASDTLFSLPDPDANDRSSGRTRTAASGNALFTIVDRKGIFDMEIIFCVCSNSGDTDAQLLRSGLFPATFKQIETLFTVPVLDDFLIDNLECKTTAQQYYSKLQLMTNKMFPHSVPVCIHFIFAYKLRNSNRTDTNNF